MANEVVSTKTRDRTLVDQVYENPVDQHEIRVRRIAGFVVLGVFLVLLAI